MSRIFELRTYEAMPGKMDVLRTRFRDHTMGFFAKYDMEVVAFWEVDDARSTAETLVYVMAFNDRADADAKWAAFTADEGWQDVKRQTESNGTVVARIDSLFMWETDFAPKI